MMKPIKTRKNPRLKGFDYTSKTAYFITICTKDRLMVLSHIEKEEDEARLFLTATGEMVEKYIKRMPGLLEYVIMPNHIHFVVIITNNDDKQGLAQRVRSFKILTSKEAGTNLWQRNYYDHIIRNENDLDGRIKYMENNPLRWVYDKYHVPNIPLDI